MMKTNSYFDITRLKHLFIRQLSFNYKVLLIATGSVVGLLLFIGTMMLVFSHRTIDQPVFLGLVMPYFFIGGYVFTSIIFSELNSSHRGYLYLTLPATSLEKLFSAWIFSSVGYILFISIVLYIINFYYISVASFLSFKTVPLFNVFDSKVLKMFGVYLVTQSVFFLGAIYFRRVNFLKTLLALFVVVVFIGIFTNVFFRIVFFRDDVNNFLSVLFNHQRTHHLEYLAEDIIVPAAKILFWGCTAPFFLTVSYFRLKEREV